MSIKNLINLEEWIEKSIKELQNSHISIKSIHIDTFRNFDKENLQALNLLDYLCRTMYEAINLIENNHDIKPYIYIHTGYTNNIVYWNNTNWSELGNLSSETVYEPPSVGFFKNNICQFFGFEVEEYKCSLNFPPKFTLKYNDLIPIFRSFRYEDDFKEFSSGIYIFFKKHIFSS